jgi:hypothetical protein
VGKQLPDYNREMNIAKQKIKNCKAAYEMPCTALKDIMFLII